MPRLALLAPLALAACVATGGPGLRPDDPPRPPIADDLARTATPFTGAGGLPLLAQRWRATTVAPRAIVVIHHGLADHGDRYAGFAHDLARAGYVVWAHDMRGHARSAGPRLLGARIDDYLDDLDALLAIARADAPDLPVYLFGHSLGGLVTCLYTIERGGGDRAPAIAGLILSAPGIAFDEPPVQAAVIRAVAAVAPGAPLLATPHADFSSSPEVVAAMDRDPLIAQGNGPVRTAAAAIDGVHRVWAQVDRLRAPVLALHGTADKLTAPSGSRDLITRAGAADRTLRLYDGLAHDLLHEPDGGAARVAADVLAWLDAHTGGGAAAPPSTPAPARLKGNRAASTISIALDVRGERGIDDADLPAAITGGLRVRAARGRATPARLGWHGGVDLRAGGDGGARFDADLYPVGIAIRLGLAGQLAIAGGVGVGRAGGDTAVRFPAEASLDLPLGPLHLLARARASADLDDGGEVAGPVDQLDGLLGLRLGRDLRYWADVVAGTGPYVGVFVRRDGDADAIGVSVGVDLWGAN